MEDIDGLEFICPADMVRIEASPRTMRGSYAGILARTAPSMKDELSFVQEVVDLVSTQEEGVILSFSGDLKTKFDLLEG